MINFLWLGPSWDPSLMAVMGAWVGEDLLLLHQGPGLLPLPGTSQGGDVAGSADERCAVVVMVLLLLLLQRVPCW